MEGQRMKKYDFYLCNKTHPEGTLLTSWCRKDMDEVRETACAMAIGANLKYKHLKIKVFESDKLVFSTCIGKGDLF